MKESEKSIRVVTIQEEVSVEENPELTKIVVEIVDMRIEYVKQRKHERIMARTLRWPISSTSHKITF